MRIDPTIEKPTRDLLGHAVRGEFDKLANVIESIGEERFLECLSLCLRVAGYIAIDVSGHEWPPDGKLQRIAHLMAEVDMGFDLAEADAYAYLSRAALGFEPLTEVFREKEKVAAVPILATATLLVSYRTDGRHWWEYLDVIERALEEAAPLSETAFPAALLLSRRNRALKTHDAVGTDG